MEKVKQKAGYIIIALMEMVFARGYIFTDKVFGDIGDGRLGILIMEHWNKALHGKEAFGSLPIFYPTEHVLSYTDLFFGEGLIYSLFRIPFQNMFLAAKYMTFFSHFMGAVAMYYFLTKVLKIKTEWALIGTIAFSYSSVMTLTFVHSQMRAMDMLPVFCIFFAKTYKALKNDGKKLIAFGLLTILSFLYILYTGWYTTFFLCLYVLIALITTVIWLAIKNREKLKDILTYMGKHWGKLTAMIAVLLVSFIPFLMIYMPGMSTFGDFDYKDAIAYLPTPAGLFNQSQRIKLWRFLHEALGMSDVHETHMGFSPLIIILFLTVLIIYAVKKGKENADKNDEIINALAIATIIGIILSIRIGDHTLWWIVFNLIPGGSAIRFPARWLFFLHFPVGVLIAYYGNKIEIKQKAAAIAVPAALALAVFASEYVSGGIEGLYRANEHDEAMSRYEAPPEDTETFFVIGDREGITRNFREMDAFELAIRFSLPSIDGYSGQIPPGYDKIREEDEETYKEGIAEWIESHGLKNVYCLNLTDGSWHRYEDLEWSK